MSFIYNSNCLKMHKGISLLNPQVNSWYRSIRIHQSPVFSTNAVNTVNFQVNFRNLHHSLQGLKLSYLHLIFHEDVNFDLEVIQKLIFVHHLHCHLHHYLLTSLFTWPFTAKLDFFHHFHHHLHHFYLHQSLLTSNFTTKLEF